MYIPYDIKKILIEKTFIRFRFQTLTRSKYIVYNFKQIEYNNINCQLKQNIVFM